MARLKKPADERLFMLIKNWLGVYLPTERKASPCTIANYRQALNQFLTYLADRNGTKLAAVTFDMMNADSLNAYLNHLQTEQNCTRPQEITGLPPCAHSFPTLRPAVRNTLRQRWM